MKRITQLLIFPIIISNFFSCKEQLPDRIIQNNLLDTTYMTSNFSTNVTRKILIEEFTGASCVNCPDGKIKLDEVLTAYPDRTLAIGLHHGALGAPVNHSKQNPDFRTKAAEEIAYKFGSNSMPSALINRKEFNGERVIGRLSWKLKVEEILNDPAKIKINSKCTLDNISNQYIYELEIEFLEDYTNEVNYTIAMLEDDIIAEQKNGSAIIENYNFEHVLRKTYTNSLGNILVKPNGSTKYEKGRIYKKQIVLDNIHASWNIDKIHLIGYITDNTTQEVIQTSKTYLK